MHKDLQSELKYLHAQIQEKRKAFDEGMKNDMEFEHLKKIFVEIKELEKRLEKCFEQPMIKDAFPQLRTDLKN